MRKTIYILSLLIILLNAESYAQVQLGRQVIGATGGYYEGANASYSYTVGEAVIKTQSTFSVSLILTQGFQQVFISDSSVSDVSYQVINESCRGAFNGSIFIDSVRNCEPIPGGGYQTEISAVDDTLTILTNRNLSAGSYNVKIISDSTCSIEIVIDVGLDSDEDCVLKFYSGITPNGDGKNDSWIIENIEQFPENQIKIFNRWGQVVYTGSNYDNNDVVWKGNTGNNDSGEELETATYFYVAKVSEKEYKGWVELTR